MSSGMAVLQDDSQHFYYAITAQTIALPRSPANQNPLAALKQRIALVHPLTNAPGLLNILRIFIGLSYRII